MIALKVVLGLFLLVLAVVASAYIVRGPYVGKTKWDEADNEDEGIQWDDKIWP